MATVLSVGLLASLLLAVGAAEAGVRLLSPRPGVRRSAPVKLGSYFSEAEIDRGAAFARPQLALGLANGLVQLGALVILARRPPPWLSRRRRHAVAASAISGAGLTIVLALPTLPLRALARRRAVAVGLVTQSWRGWAVDLAKSTAIETVLAAGGGALVAAAIRRCPRRWWAVGAAGSVVVGSLFAALAPVALDPIFNDYTPLDEGETRRDVLELAEAAGIRIKEVYAVDASRRTTAANAYVTGLGPTKRVVLFDTLLDRYNRAEVRVVVAHELAHVRHRDVPRGMAYAAIVAPAGALAIQRLSWALSDEREPPGALLALALAAAIVGAPLGVIGNRLSRALERRADAYSLELTHSPEAFVSFEQAIALQNVADLDPPRWVRTLLATHPTTAERIGAAVSYAGG
jgi:STE24 endopeptidase